MNKVLLCGRLGREPELRYTQSQKAVANFSIATNEGKNKDGTERTEWHNIVCWEKTAELAKKYLGKGSQVIIEGSLSTKTYDKDAVKHWKTEVICHRLEFVGEAKKKDEAQTAQASALASGDNVSSMYDDMDLPF